MPTIQNDLSDNYGALWIMIKLDDTWFRDDEDRNVANAIVQFVLANDLGEIDGESSGAGAMDINFTVHSKRQAARKLDEFISKLNSDMTYYIDDRYSPLFEV